MSTVKNRASLYLTRAKLASSKPVGSSKVPASRSKDRPYRPIDHIDAAGYVHWNLSAKRTD